MSVETMDVFVIIKWPAESGYPRYSFATLPHAAEIQTPIERVETCSTIEKATAIIARLNDEDGTAA